MGTIYYGEERGLGWARFHVNDGGDFVSGLGGRGYGFDIEVEARNGSFP